MNINKQIEFDKIKEMWSDLAVTDYAKEKIKNARRICVRKPSRYYEELQMLKINEENEIYRILNLK